MTLTERNALGVLILVGLTLAALVEIYDTRSAMLRIGLALVNLAVSFVVLRSTLERLGVQRDRSIPAAVWGLLGWSVVPLSQMAVVGYLLIPIEVIVGTSLASFRGGISMARACLSVSMARGVALAATIGVRALL